MKPCDELPWWCQLLWPWFGPPWYEQVADMDAYLAAYWCALHLSAAELAELLAGDDPPGEGYLAKARRLTAARLQAQAIISGGCGPPAPEGEDAGDEYDEPIPDMGRPLVVGRDHPSWAEVDAEQRERIGAPLAGDKGLHEVLLEQFGDQYLEEQGEVGFLISEEEPRTLAEIIEAAQEFFDNSGTCGASRTRMTSASSLVTSARG